MVLKDGELPLGAAIGSCGFTDEKMYLKLVIPTQKSEIRNVGDIVCGGVCISNSEIGQGALNVRAMLYELSCTNGATFPISMGGVRRTHIGIRRNLGGARSVTLQQMIEELPSSCCETVYNKTFQWKSITVRVAEYLLLTFPKTKEPAALVALRTAFPTFGTRCENSQRVHISNDGRLIESRHKPEMEGRKLDNHQNGEIVFIDTDSTGADGDFNDQPTPCTIKVSIKKECENLKGIYKIYRDEKAAKDKAEKAAKAARDKAEKAEKAARAAMEKAAKDAATREAIAKAAKEASAKKLTKSLRKIEVAAGEGGTVAGAAIAGGGAQQQHSEDEEPTSPSMPELYTIPTFPSQVNVPLASLASLASTSTAPVPVPVPVPVPQKCQFSAEDMKEMLRMSLAHITSAEAQAILKAQVMEKYGFNDL